MGTTALKVKVNTLNILLSVTLQLHVLAKLIVFDCSYVTCSDVIVSVLVCLSSYPAAVSSSSLKAAHLISFVGVF